MGAARNATWTGMNWIRQSTRLAIYLRDGLSCVYCGDSVERLLAQPGEASLKLLWVSEVHRPHPRVLARTGERHAGANSDVIDEIRIATDFDAVTPFVPEPTSLALLGVGGLLMMRRGRSEAGSA